ncbi:MAG TPA: AgmX/PglI C-terminal domain-containing protein [Myxococcales bacterium]|jgi:hypothetical protein
MAEAEETTPRIQRFRAVDRTFVAIVAAVFLFNFGLASAIASRAKTWTDDWALVEELTTGRVTSGPLLPLRKKGKPTAKAEGEGVRVAVAGPARGNGGRPKPELDRLVKSSALLKIIGSEGLGDGWKLENRLWDGHEAASLEKAMQEARGSGVALRLDGGGEHRGGSTGETKSIGDLRTEGGPGEGSKQLADRGPTRPKPRVTFEEEEDPTPAGPGCDRAAIAKVVKRGLGALQACYEYETKKVPTLNGKIVVRFAIGEAGGVTEVEIDEDSVGSPGLRRCLERTLRRWLFPPVPGECVVSHPIVFAPIP